MPWEVTEARLVTTVAAFLHLMSVGAWTWCPTYPPLIRLQIGVAILCTKRRKNEKGPYLTILISAGVLI